MPRRKSLGLAITALGLVAATVAGARSDSEDTALRLLVKAFDRVSPRNVLAVMRMSMDNAQARQTVQVQIARDGRQRVEVVGPAHRARVVILEDGQFRETYNPDTRTLSISRSAAATAMTPAERLRLVRRNYTLRMKRNVALANLSNVVRIDATSHYKEVGGATIYIDPDSCFVMGVDSIAPSGRRIRRFDTTQLSYPSSFTPETFTLNGVVINSTERETDPVAVPTVKEATRLAGFAPLMPRGLPFGFVVRQMYIKSDPTYTSIGFNISDGLAAATVFEFNLRHSPAAVRNGFHQDMKHRPDDFFSAGDTTVGIVSNLSRQARKQLLDAFRRHRNAALNDAEKIFIAGDRVVLSFGLGTNPICLSVTPYRRMWRSYPQPELQNPTNPTLR